MSVREAGSLYSCKKVPRSVVGEKSCYAEMSADVLTLLSVSERKKKKSRISPTLENPAQGIYKRAE